jgi:hypothetical protein
MHFFDRRIGEAVCSLGWMMDFFISLNFSILLYTVKIIIKFYIGVLNILVNNKYGCSKFPSMYIFFYFFITFYER